MVKLRLINRLSFFIVLPIMISSCVNLRSVHEYADSSIEGIQLFEDINYSFEQHCTHRCKFEAIQKIEIQRELTCKCDIYRSADSITLLIYNSINGYFDGLVNLSENNLTDYNVDALNTALTEGEFGNITIKKEHVESYISISKILLKATTDSYRKKKISEYIKGANQPLKVLIDKFGFILKENLVEALNFKKEKLYTYYNEMLSRNTLSDYEKGNVTEKYYNQLEEIDRMQKEMLVFTKNLETISEGHQKLYDNRNKITDDELKRLLVGYANDIQDIITEFNKLKK